MRKTVWVIALHSAGQREKVGRILTGYGYRMFRLDGSAIISENIDTDEIYALPG
jgi:hypothetical protein